LYKTLNIACVQLIHTFYRLSTNELYFSKYIVVFHLRL